MNNSIHNDLPLPCSNNSFNENWLPGISFDDNNDTFQNDAETHIVAPSCAVATTTRRPNLVVKHRRITPAPSPSNNCTFPCRALQEGNESCRRVHFACHESLETSHAPPILSELQEDDIRTLWWQSSDLLQMKRYTRYLMMNKNNEDWIGLDRFTVERTACKKRAVRLVLLAQHQQRIHTVSDHPDEFIRSVSKRCSRWTRNMALAIGQQLYAEIYVNNVGLEEQNVIPTESGIEDDKIPSPALTVVPSPSSNIDNKMRMDHAKVFPNKRSHPDLELAQSDTETVNRHKLVPKRCRISTV